MTTNDIAKARGPGQNGYRFDTWSRAMARLVCQSLPASGLIVGVLLELTDADYWPISLTIETEAGPVASNPFDALFDEFEIPGSPDMPDPVWESFARDRSLDEDEFSLIDDTQIPGAIWYLALDELQWLVERELRGSTERSVADVRVEVRVDAEAVGEPEHVLEAIQAQLQQHFTSDDELEALASVLYESEERRQWLVALRSARALTLPYRRS